MSGSKITIREIATLCGVSITTVSRYLNGKFDSMSESTREKIAKTIEEYGYRPDNIARSMKSSSRVLGCVIDDITNPITSIYIKAVTDYASSKGYQVLIFNTDDDAEKERNSINSLLDNRAEGVVIMTTGLNNEFLVDLHEQGFPIVSLDRGITQKGKIDTVCTESYRSAYNCVSFLKDQGYESISFFTSSLEHITSRINRYHGYSSAIKDLYGNAAKEDVRILDKGDLEQFKVAVADFVAITQGQSAAIFTVNGVTMLTVLQAMQALGLRPHFDLGVCGFDDWGWASLVGGGISTIVQDSRQVGIRAAELLLNRINGVITGKPKYVEIPNELIVRESTTIVRANLSTTGK